MTAQLTTTRSRHTLKRTVGAFALAAVPMLVLSGCSKPSSADVSTGLVKIFKGQGLDEAASKKVADCAAPDLVDKLSKTTLDNYADGKDLTATDDTDEAKSIIEKCVTSTGAGS